MSPDRSLRIATRLELDRFPLSVDLDLGARVSAVFGPSGSGKTSLLETVAGLRPRARGSVVLGGRAFQDDARGLFLPPEDRRVGYVPQDRLLFPHLSVRRNLRVGEARARALGRSIAGFSGVCQVLELEELLERDVATLSGGEAQRVAIGRALLSAPELLLLDEPTAGLDLGLRRRILPFLQRVKEEYAVPMLVVSHDPTVALALADEVVALRRGAVVARGLPHRVLVDPSVYHGAGEVPFENVLRGRLLGETGGSRAIALGETTRLVVPPVRGEAGRPVMLGIPAREIIVATERPRAISAQNVLPARLEGLNAAGDTLLVSAALADHAQPALVAEITARAGRELELRPGREVYLVIKATGIAVYG